MNPLAWWCRWRCERAGFDGITALNTADEWEHASRDTLLFHWLFKWPIVALALWIRVPRTWIDQLDGNYRVLYDTAKATYFDQERQGRRKAILWPLIEFALCKCAFDDNFDEVAQPLLSAIIASRDRLVFDPNIVNPDNWYQDGRGRIRVETSHDPVRIHAITDTELVVDRDLGGKVISVTGADGAASYLAIDLAGAVTLYPGIVVYPIVARGASVLDVAPALFEVPA